MPISGSAPNKTFTREVATFTGSDAFQQVQGSGRKILSIDQDEAGNDIAEALNSMVMLDGGNVSADIPLNSNKFTGVENAAARDQFAAAGQVQDGSFCWAGTSTGTNTIAATLTPAITAYAAGQVFRFIAGGTNTGAATINFNTVGAADIKKGPAGTTALAANDIVAGGIYSVVYNGTTGDFELINPGTQNITITAAGAALLDDADAAAQRTTLGIDINDDVTFGSVTAANASGSEGGQINLAVPASGHSLSGSVVSIDIGANSVRFFEGGGTARGASMDLTTMGAGATTAIFHSSIAATQAQMEAASSLVVPVVPGRMHFHPGVAKAWAYVNVPSGTPTILASYNIGSVVDGGVGIMSIVYITSFSSANNAPLVSSFNSTTGIAHVADFTASNVVVHSRNAGNSLQDPFGVMLVSFGDF